MQQETAYPYDGDVVLTVKKGSGNFAMNIRIPGWVRNQVVPSDLYQYNDSKRLGYSLQVNGVDYPVGNADLRNGYAVITRKWKTGDQVKIHFDMEPRIVKANAQVEADLGRVSVERGPLVYCAEWPDNPGFDVRSILINQTPEFKLENKNILDKYPVKMLSTEAQVLKFNGKGELAATSVRVNMIPYYAWNHRGRGSMLVWIPQELRACSPAMPPTLASRSTVKASHEVPGLGAINDRLVPKGAEDRSVPYYHYWPKQGGTEWIEYHFPEAQTVQSSTVYWFDDSPWGGCKVPAAWRILYKNADGQWSPVTGADRYTCKKGVSNMVQFDPVETTALRLEIDQPKDASCGLFEWEVR